MSAIDGAGPSDVSGARPGIDRRSMIKGAAIAGAAAWTAPVIIDSLVSPAAAASAPGCYYIRINDGSTSSVCDDIVTWGSPTCGFSQTCTGTSFTSVTTDSLSTYNLTETGVCRSGSGSQSFTITHSACVWVDGTVNTTRPGRSDVCVDGVLSNSDRTITFTMGSSRTAQDFYLLMKCT